MPRFYIIFFISVFTVSVLGQDHPPRPDKGGTAFFFENSDPLIVQSISVAGSFNRWNNKQYPMVYDSLEKYWTVVIPLSAGTEYLYKYFLNDSLWIADPNAPAVSEDEWKNCVITPQPFGIPFVSHVFPGSNSRVSSVPEIFIRFDGEYPVNPQTIVLKVNGTRTPFTFDHFKGALSARIDSSSTDGEYTILVSFSDIKGQRNPGFRSVFFLDRYIKSITSPSVYDSLVMYEIFIRRFRDSDGDGTGDFNGITQSLDYLRNDLGIDVIWTMPFNESRTKHGYNVSDYFAIEKDYGTFADYQTFLSEAKKRDIRVIMDFVVNHSDSTHPYFLDAYKNPSSPYSGWYQFINKDNSDWKHFGEDRTMPKLNFENSEVQEYVLSIARYWMDPNGDGDFSDGVDGFRCDAAREVPHRFWNRFRKELKALRSDLLLLGEVWDQEYVLIPFYKEAFDMLFDYPIFYAFENYFINGDGAAIEKKSDLLNTIYPAGYQSVRFLSNHDNARALTFMQNDTVKLKQAAFLLFTLPGTPMIYYGEEIGLTGALPDYNVRQPFEWETLRNQMKDEKSIWHFYKSLIALRKSYPVLSARDDSKTESLTFFHSTDGLLTFARRAYDQKALIIINPTEQAVTNPVFYYSEKGGPDTHPLSVIFGERYSSGNTRIVPLKGNAFCIEGCTVEPGGFILLK